MEPVGTDGSIIIGTNILILPSAGRRQPRCTPDGVRCELSDSVGATPRPEVLVAFAGDFVNEAYAPAS